MNDLEEFKVWIDAQFNDCTWYTDALDQGYLHVYRKDTDDFWSYEETVAWYTWQSKQAEVDQLSTQNELLKKIAEDDMAKIERLESVINQNDAELKEKDKWIETALDLLIDGHYELAEQMLRGERE